MRKFIVTGTIVITLFSSTVLAGERLNLGYIYSASKSHSEIIEFTNNSVNVVSPTCFDMTQNGRLEINGILDREFIDEMHEKGIKVTPFLSNHWGKKRAQAALRNPYPIIQEVVNAVYEYNLDGVNVDIENLDSKDKDALTNFMKLMREAMPADKTVSIAVAANPEKLTTTWIAAYDYKALAEYVDYMVVMTYDEHCYGGAEGPVAGINFVEKSIQAVLEEVSRDKVVMGIPLYGRFWQQGKDVGGEAIVIANVPRLIKKHKLVPKYNEIEQTPFVQLEVYEGGTSSYINGRMLEPGVYNIYYENENSIKAKLEIVNKYDILGTGLWALDNEDADFWTYYKDALNAKPYETEAEVKYRKKLEYAAKYFVVTEEKTDLLPEASLEYAQKVNLKLDYNVNTVTEKKVDVRNNMTEIVFVLPSKKKSKAIKIKRFYIDENNELKASESNLYYNTSYVETVSSKVLLVV